MDISGETQTDISHNVVKSRLNSKGEMVPNSAISQLGSDLDKISNVKQDNYCGSCYGGTEPEGGCCNTCESVRQAYVNRGWSFSDPEAIDQVCTRNWGLRFRYLTVLQCKNEKWADKLKEQADEGCNVSGRIRVNKVVGNIHLSPGRSFQTSSRNLYELVPYLREEKDRHDFSHTIHHLAFESELFSFFLTFCIEDGFRRWWVWLLESRSGQRHEGSHGSCWESFGWCGSSGVYPSYCVFGFLNRIMGFNRLANPCICSNISSRSSPLNFAPWMDRK